jgi:hypothetical protein
VVCSILLIAFSPPAAAQETSPTPALRVNATELTIGGRVQTQFNTSSVDSVPWSELILRRARLETAIKVSELVSGRLQADFAGDRVAIRDAYLRLRFSSALQVVAGRAQRPFGILTQTSSALAPVAERGAVIRGIEPLDEHNLVEGLGYSGRDLGVQLAGELKGAPLGFSYVVGYFNGPVRGRTGHRADDPEQYAGRLSVAPLSRVRLGASASRRDFRAPEQADAATATTLRSGTAWAVDAEFGAFEPGLHVLGELAWGDYDPFREISFFGAQSWLAYRTGRLGPVVAHLEPMLRVSYGNLGANVPATLARRAGTLLTPGLNVYFDRLNRFMLNYDAWLPGSGASRESSFKAMFQLAF